MRSLQAAKFDLNNEPYYLYNSNNITIPIEYIIRQNNSKYNISPKFKDNTLCNMNKKI